MVVSDTSEGENTFPTVAATKQQEETKLPCVVADAAAFIRNVDLANLSDRVFTVRDVVAEIRDSNTKQRLAVLPYELNFRTPSSESLHAVTQFSKKTGDYKSLSAVDLQVLALTYQLEKEFCDVGHIKSEPTRKATVVDKTPVRSDKDILGFYVEKRMQKETVEEGEKGDEENEENEEGKENGKEEEEVMDTGERNCDEVKAVDTPTEEVCIEMTPTLDAVNVDEGDGKEHVKWLDDEDKEEEIDDDDDDDGGGWITPKNLEKVNKTFGMVGGVNIEESNVKCACLTTDFAMQNVLIQMGLHVLSVEGRLIRQARSYIQKCFGCYKETYDMSRIFCASCGNKTLKKVAVTVGEDGAMQYHYPKRQRNPNIRGTKFSIPTPKGGRHVDQMLLVEDQPTGKNHLPKSRDKVDPMDPNYGARSNPFATNDVTSRAFNLGLHLKQRQPRNPNESKKKKSGRKK